MRAMSFRWLLPIMVLLFAFWGSLFLFYPLKVSPFETLHALFSHTNNAIADITITNLRLPRALGAILIGAALGVAGTLLQTLTRNPLASPTLLGINSGASLAMVIATAISPAVLSSFSVSLVAAVGGGLSWALVMLISQGWTQHIERTRIVLAGIAVSMLCAALTKMTLILSEDNAYGIMSWLAGNISHIRWSAVLNLAVFSLPAIAVSLLFANKLNIMNLSDDNAKSLGIDLAKLRVIINLAALILVGVSVSVAGPFAFIGLLVPHLSRYWVGYDLRKALPMTALFGAILMLLADSLARAVTFPNELPVGAILALIGAPFFVWIAQGKR